MVKKTILWITLAVLALVIGGCQTVQGVGGDIQWLGAEGAALLEGE